MPDSASSAAGGGNVEKDLDQLERKLNDLRSRYEQYFLGIEKREPRQLRDEVAQLVRRYSGVPIQNTGAKFRYTTLVARYNSFNAVWTRTLREIESGTYKRDVFRADLHDKEAGKAPAGEAPAKVAKTVSTTTPPAKNDAIGQLLQQYLDARKQTKEPIQGITREALETLIKKQSAAIQQQYQVKRVTFKVVVEDGKAKIKALPKKE